MVLIDIKPKHNEKKLSICIYIVGLTKLLPLEMLLELWQTILQKHKLNGKHKEIEC